MGYYSEIALALPKKYEIALRLDTKNSDAVAMLDKGAKRTEFSSFSVFYIHSCKWYPDFPEVNQMKSYLDTLEQEDFGFIRIGEDLDDIEALGFYWYYDMDISRNILFQGNND